MPTKTSRYEPEKQEVSRKSKRQPPDAEPTKVKPLLNRDGVPYKPGGPYREQKRKAGAAAAAADGADLAGAEQP
eukprot:1565712-Pleurochrysis_carterae.AAC.1